LLHFKTKRSVVAEKLSVGLEETYLLRRRLFGLQVQCSANQ